MVDLQFAEIVNLFPTFYITQKFSSHDTYKDILFNTEFCKETLDEIPSVNKSPMSPYNTYPCVQQNDENLDHDVFPEFMRDLDIEINSMLSQNNLRCKSEIMNIWYNIYGENNYHDKHTHIGAFTHLSGVYFFKNPGSKEFAFYNPLSKFLEGSNLINETFYNSDLQHTVIDIAYPNVQEGDIILFPPFIEHGVNPVSNESDTPRVTIAFNCRLSEDTQTPPSPTIDSSSNQISFVTH